MDIFLIKQTVIGMHQLGHVHWFVPARVDTVNTVWNE
jgi:hypothetical protein